MKVILITILTVEGVGLLVSVFLWATVAVRVISQISMCVPNMAIGPFKDQTPSAVVVGREISGCRSNL